MQSRKSMSAVFGPVFLTAMICAGCTANHGILDSGKNLVKNGVRKILFNANKLAYPKQNPNLNPGELDALGSLYGTDKTREHHYTEVYEYFLSPLKYKAKKILEIGILDGASIKMWRDYFPGAIIHGIDIIDESRFNSNRIKTFIADQADRNKLQDCIKTFGADFDFIVDDGGHSMNMQQISFGFLFKYVKPHGFYIIEDVHTSIHAHYGKEYGAMENGENTTLAMIDTFIRTGSIKSTYMTPEEETDLTSHLEYCNLFSRDNGMSITCIFRKKSSK